ncbi:unnamed protein product, partial [Prorocentrum cordatum]
ALKPDLLSWQLQLAKGAREGIEHGALVNQIRRWVHNGKGESRERKKWKPLAEAQRGHARFVADQFRAPVADRQVRWTRELKLNAVVHWVATDGAKAAELRGNFECNYVGLSSKGALLYFAQHGVIE